MLKARRIGSNVVLDRSRSFDGKCDYCGKHGELRPFQPTRIKLPEDGA